MGVVYADQSDLEARGIPAAALASVASDVITAALKSASSKVDSYLSKRFELPLTSYGDDIVECVCKIAAYNLVTVRGISPGNGAYESLRDGFDDQIKWLRDISLGRATPAFPSNVDADGFNPNDQAFVQAPPRPNDSEDEPFVSSPANVTTRGW